jgi:hypothetical protein
VVRTQAIAGADIQHVPARLHKLRGCEGQLVLEPATLRRGQQSAAAALSWSTAASPRPATQVHSVCTSVAACRPHTCSRTTKVVVTLRLQGSMIWWPLASGSGAMGAIIVFWRHPGRPPPADVMMAGAAGCWLLAGCDFPHEDMRKKPVSAALDCAPVVGIEFTIERERSLPVVETNSWEFRGCFSS